MPSVYAAWRGSDRDASLSFFVHTTREALPILLRSEIPGPVFFSFCSFMILEVVCLFFAPNHFHAVVPSPQQPSTAPRQPLKVKSASPSLITVVVPGMESKASIASHQSDVSSVAIAGGIEARARARVCAGAHEPLPVEGLVRHAGAGKISAGPAVPATHVTAHCTLSCRWVIPRGACTLHECSRDELCRCWAPCNLR